MEGRHYVRITDVCNGYEDLERVLFIGFSDSSLDISFDLGFSFLPMTRRYEISFKDLDRPARAFTLLFERELVPTWRTRDLFCNTRELKVVQRFLPGRAGNEG